MSYFYCFQILFAKSWGCPPVEDVAGNRQREVTQLFRRGIVPQQRQRQEEKDEKVR